MYWRMIRWHPTIRNHASAITAFAIAMLAHATVASVSINFFYLPTGTEIRPMGWSMVVLLVSFLSLILAAPVGIWAIIKERPRLLGVFGVIGGLTPLFTALSMLNFAIKTRGLQMLP